jgi:hypothetical protein
MTDPKIISEMEHLFGGLLKGELTPEQGARFAQLLDRDTATMDDYLRLIFVTAFLRESQTRLPQPLVLPTRPAAVHGTGGLRGITSRWRAGVFRRMRPRFLRAG